MDKVFETNVPSAFERIIDQFYKPNEFDQLPFKFPTEPSQKHQTFIEQTTTKNIDYTIGQQLEQFPTSASTLSTFLENTAHIATQDVTSDATDVILGQEMTFKNVTENVTSIIEQSFGNVSSSTEDGTTNFSFDLGTKFVSNSTESTDLVTFINSTSEEIGTTHAPEHIHYEDYTTIIILSVVICLLILSIVVGLIFYFRKKKMSKQAELNSSNHIVSFNVRKSPGSTDAKSSGRSRPFLSSSNV